MLFQVVNLIENQSYLVIKTNNVFFETHTQANNEFYFFNECFVLNKKFIT